MNHGDHFWHLPLKLLGLALIAVILIACGGGDWEENLSSDPVSPPQPEGWPKSAI